MARNPQRWSVASLVVVLAVAGVYHLRGHQVQAQAPSATGAAPTPARAASQSPQSAAPAATAPSGQRAFLNQYCVTCHNDRLRTGGLALDGVNVDRVSEAPEVWEKVVHMLRASAMPPAGRPRPTPAVANQFAGFLETQLDRLATASPNAGSVPPHRLNRTEYTNAIRDLLGLEISPSLLPADGSLLGFDNIAGVLSVSPTLLERYMTVARQVSRLAVGDPTLNVAPVTYIVEGILKQEDRINEDLPFGARGVTYRHNFPLDGEYVVRIRLKRDNSEYIAGLGREPQPLEVRLDGERLTVFSEAGLMKGMPPPEGYTQEEIGDPQWEDNALEQDNRFEVRFAAKAGMHVLAIALPAKRWASDEEFLLPSGARRDESRDGHILVRTVEISAPLNSKVPDDSVSRRKIFSCRPTNAADEEKCATTILSSLARRAYRRPLVEEDIKTSMDYCRAGRSQRGFEGCIQAGLERILASPHFLFRVDTPPANAAVGSAYRLNDLDLASRLSFFLWSSIPDDELLDAATQGRLRTPAVLERQVRRMLSDPRSKSLVDSFAAQWLELRKLETATPLEGEFPDFDGELRDALKQETERFLDSMLREDRPIGELLTANYTFLNERLARHYGVPNIIGSHFRRVTMSSTGWPGNQRVGLLGHGSILTVTSQANRTSPVLRGKWVLDNVLGASVPPPPPDVPALKPASADGTVLTGRGQLEQHRASPVCANCHSRMDPWGFALENFDAVGAWRENDDGQWIDTEVALLDGTKFDGPAGVRKVLLDRREQFVKTVSEKLLVYGLGRPLEYYDRPALRKITREAVKQDFRWSSVILGIVNSVPFQFQMRGAE